jgi:acyl carrier protein
MNTGEIVIEREEIRQTLMKLFEAETGEAIESPLTDEMNMAEELGLDSVDMVSLIMQLERHFKIRLTHEELTGAAQVGKLLDIVQQKVTEQKEAAQTCDDAQKAAA